MTQPNQLPQTPALKKPRANIANSDAVRKAVEARRMVTPLAVQGISPGTLHKIAPTEFCDLDVDPAYQRGETSMVTHLITAIQAGGLVLDPVTLCKRTSWGKEKKKLWIVDGYQRVCAHQQLGQAFQAMVHESDSLDAEKKFFLALNNRRGISSDTMVKGWTGPSGRMMLSVNTQPSHSLFGRVNFANGKNQSRLSAAMLVRGSLCATVSRGAGRGGIQKNLSRLDVALGPPPKRALAESYLRLMGDVFPKGSCNTLVALGIGEILHSRMGDDGLPYPTLKVIDRLQRINWRHEVPVLNAKFLPMILALIEKAWR